MNCNACCSFSVVCAGLSIPISFEGSATPVRNEPAVPSSLGPPIVTRTRSRSESNVGMETLEVPILVKIYK